MSDGHHHHHSSSDNLKVAFFLNLGFTILEVIGGFWTNSIAVLTDSVHDFGDSISLDLAWSGSLLDDAGFEHITLEVEQPSENCDSVEKDRHDLY